MSTLTMVPMGNYTIGHRSINMFKFPAIATGLATQINLNTEPCTIGFTLYRYKDKVQIGDSVINSTFDVSRAKWVLYTGTTYYLTFQTNATCNLPCGITTKAGYGIITEKDPADGGYIHMSISGTLLSATPVHTPSLAPVRPDIVSQSMTYSEIIVSKTPTPTPSYWMLINSGSPVPLNTSTVSEFHHDSIPVSAVCGILTGLTLISTFIFLSQ